jgi:ribosomal protein L37AE/L43A
MDAVDTLGCIGIGIAIIYGLALSIEWWMRPRVVCPRCGQQMRESYLTPGVWYCRHGDCGRVVVK